MQVLQLSKFYPPVHGGIESVAFELTERMNRAGTPTDVLCAGETLRTTREQAPAGYQIIRAGSLGRLLSTSVSPALVLESCRLLHEYDVVHVHAPDPMAALAVRLARPRGRVVLHWHSDIVSQQRALKLYRPLQSWLLRRADAIVATSPAYAASSAWLQPWRSKVSVIPIGISEPTPGPDDARVAAIRDRFGRRRLVFSLGRMTYYKGFDVLIDAAAHLPPDCMIVVGGGGELLAYFRGLVQARGLCDRIVFVGRVEDGDVLNYFAAADVFCLPSTVRAEAFGVVLLEAMAMSKPLVVADIPGSGVPWVNQHGVTGLTVPPNDSVALAEGLSCLLTDTALAQRLGRGARERFTACFTADAMVASALQLYADLVGGDVAMNSTVSRRAVDRVIR